MLVFEYSFTGRSTWFSSPNGAGFFTGRRFHARERMSSGLCGRMIVISMLKDGSLTWVFHGRLFETPKKMWLSYPMMRQ